MFTSFRKKSEKVKGATNLYRSIIQENLEKVKEAIENEAADPNQPSLIIGMRPLCLAAITCNLPIFLYLLDKGAKLSADGNYQLENNLLFCICADYGRNEDKRSQILNWLLNNYEKLEIGLQKELILAALGEAPEKGFLGVRDKSGFLPSHYAAMVGNKNLIKWCSETGELEEDGQQSQGITVSWILGVNNRSLLVSYAEHCKAIDFNSTPFSDLPLRIIHGYQGLLSIKELSKMRMTFAWQLALHQPEFLQEYLTAHTEIYINLEAVYDSPYQYGSSSALESVFSLLFKNSKFEVLQSIFDSYNTQQLESLLNHIKKSDEKDNNLEAQEFCKLALAKKYYAQLCKTLTIQTQENKEKEKEKEKETQISEAQSEEYDEIIAQIFNYLHDIKRDSKYNRKIQEVIGEDSKYYREAQTMIGNVLFDLLKYQKIHALLWTILADYIENTIIRPTSIEYQLRFYMNVCLARGTTESQERAIQLRASLYQECEKFQLENKIMSGEIEALTDTHFDKADKVKESRDENTLPENQVWLEKEEIYAYSSESSEPEPVPLGTIPNNQSTHQVAEKFKLQNLLEILGDIDVQEAKKFVENENIDLRADFTEYQLQFINIAAISGNLEVVQYLFEEKTWKIEVTRAIDNLLFACCTGYEEDKRKAILEWLLENNRFEQLDLGLTKEHIEAALGLLPSEGFIGVRDKNGFLPCHYAAMVGSPNLFAWCSKNGKLEENTEATKGISVSLLLAKSGHIELLKLYYKKFANAFNPKAIFLEPPYQGENFFLILASCQEWPLVYEIAEQHAENINWTATPVTGNLQGVHILWLFAFFEQWYLLDKYSDFYKNIHWNAAPVNEFQKPYTIKKQFIAATDDNKQSEEGFPENYGTEYFEMVDNFKDASFAWLLSKKRRTDFIIKNFRSFYENTEIIDLYSGPVLKQDPTLRTTVFDELINAREFELVIQLIFLQSISFDFLLEKRPRITFESDESAAIRFDELVENGAYDVILLIVELLSGEDLERLKEHYSKNPIESLYDYSLTLKAAEHVLLANRCHRKISQSLTIKECNEEEDSGEKENDVMTKKQITKEIEESFEEMFKHLNFAKHAYYCAQVNIKIAHIIRSYINEPVMIPLLWNELEKEIQKEIRFDASISKENQLRIYMEILFSQSKEEVFLATQLMAEMFAKCEKLHSTNHPLKTNLLELREQNQNNDEIAALPSIRENESLLFWQDQSAGQPNQPDAITPNLSSSTEMPSPGL